MTPADHRGYLRSVLGAGEADTEQYEYVPREEDYEAPGWDVDAKYYEERNKSTESYMLSCFGNFPQLNTLTPVPSQKIDTYYHNRILTITLDSGATLSFIRLNEAILLGIHISPNGQLTTLADEETKLASKGEIDIEIVVQGIVLRLRALVVEKLQAVCYGGTNFHLDNKITADIDLGTILVHGQFTIRQSNPKSITQVFPPSQITVNGGALTPFPPSRLKAESSSNLCQANDGKVEEMNKMRPSMSSMEQKKTKTVNIPHRQTALPGESVLVTIPEPWSGSERIAVVPSFDQMKCSDWLPQVCEVEEGVAIYRNNHEDRTISHPKHAHFKTIPVNEVSLAGMKKSSKSPVIAKNPVNMEVLIRDIKINEKMLSRDQLMRLKKIHAVNCNTFDGDLSGGYNHKQGWFEAKFGFKDNSKPPPLKVWTPQYNRSCLDLLQAKCDQLQSQGVLADPAELGIDVKHVSPIMIQQKGRAKHKDLADCTLDEIRFISCQNVLNESIRPVPSSSTSHVKIFKFLGRWKFHIFADMHNSYFQIPVEKRMWGYLAINTPFRGMRVMTRTGQGLLNSDVHLDQLLMKVLGDEITEGICEVARDDIQVGGNTIDEVIDNWEKVLRKLNMCDLKISPHKVRILLDDTEVYGFRIRQGYVLQIGRAHV